MLLSQLTAGTPKHDLGKAMVRLSRLAAAMHQQAEADRVARGEAADSLPAMEGLRLSNVIGGVDERLAPSAGVEAREGWALQEKHQAHGRDLRSVDAFARAGGAPIGKEADR